VPVTFSSLSAYVAGVADLVTVRPGDRHSQTFDLSFDLSMHDIFVTLANGATIVQPSSMDMLMPGSYIQKKKLDVWFSVPFLASLATSSIREGDEAGHRMRLALFCGEQLSSDCARRFQHFMAADSETYNLYGPTEATIAFTGHRYSAAGDMGPNVPIGRPFGSNTVAVLDDHGGVLEATAGVEGELLLAGPQVFAGYSPEVSVPFIYSNGHRYYRSGDRVRCDETGIHHIGRTDQQMKLRGYRIEAAEVEAVCRSVFGLEHAVALVVGAAPRTRLVLAYVADTELAQPDFAKLQPWLPSYMVPSEFRRLQALPLNSNSKVDRKAIAQLFA
jgi:non-ribosomal peptide synthetase component F